MEAQLEITSFGHAAVGLRLGEVTVIVDPGEFSQFPALDSFDAVLVTHDHFDHVDLDALGKAQQKKPELRVFSPVALEGVNAELVADGDAFAVGDLQVNVVGEEQAIASIYDPPIPNVGYLFAGKALHPGDAYQEIQDVDTLFLPMDGPWVKRADQERHLSQFPPKRIIPIHDVLFTTTGRDFARHTAEEMAARIGVECLVLHEGQWVGLD